MGKYIKVDHQDQEITPARHYMLVIILTILGILVGITIIMMTLFGKWAPQKPLLFISGNTIHFIVIFVMDVLSLFSIFWLIRFAWSEFSLKLTNEGIRKTNFWGEEFFFRWEEIEEVRTSSEITFFAKNKTLSISPDYFVNICELRALLEYYLPWFNAEGGVVVPGGRWGQFTRVYERNNKS